MEYRMMKRFEVWESKCGEMCLVVGGDVRGKGEGKIKREITIQKREEGNLVYDESAGDLCLVVRGT